MRSSSPFAAVGPQIDLVTIEREILLRWREEGTFQRSLAINADGPKWVFYEGPPTANGRPGVHHVEARVFKDVFPRYRTMKGYNVPRRAGWDCHGLPVEIAVEKELELSGKQDIERVGVAEFNARCRQSVQRHVADFEAMTERLGYWVDTSAAYWTMSAEYVESVWWSLKQIQEKGLLVEDYRVAPYCPRCGTGLSDHEVAQGYETVVDTSVFVRMPVIGEIAGFAGVDLLIWTTTPWTLVSNTAIAVNPEVVYVIAKTGQGTFVVAEGLADAVLGTEFTVLAHVPGTTLAGLRYEPPLNLVQISGAHVVVLADYVTTEDGTGLVHQAPAFGVDDMVTCRANGLPVVNPIEADGRFGAAVPLVGGVFFKDANSLIIKDLASRDLLLRASEYEHSYPHCWRCHTPLMYYAQLTWYIRTTQISDALLRENQRTDWHPQHIQNGRFGDWLKNNMDWALSRSRYWGTPLPLWRCAQGHLKCVASRAELGELAGRDLSELDPHRPFIDEVTFDCPECGSPSFRVPEVIDAWYDSGAMPFAQFGYPHKPGSVEEFETSYPAQFIAEAIDQTRGWFYTLMAVGTLVFDRSSYDHVLCLGHIVAEDGRKMSKHLGNVLEPIPLMDKHGADALRWFMLCAGSPWSSRRVGDGPIADIVRRFLLTYWNTVSFFTLYAETADWAPDNASEEQRTPLDRWLRAELHELVGAVDNALEQFDTATAGRLIGQFVDDLSNWYVRLSRSRFWAGDAAALATLYEALDVLTRLMAPFIPFLTEHVWQVAIRPGIPAGAPSVHLAKWPVRDETALDAQLRADMATVRTLVEVGRAARKSNNVRIRQPLAQALVSVPNGRLPGPELMEYLLDELNVRSVSALDGAATVIDVTVKPNFRHLGQRFGAETQSVAAAIRAGDPAALANAVRDGAAATLMVGGQPVEITAEDLIVSQSPRSGWTVASARETTVAIDTTITAELRRAGLVREAIRLLQETRKQAGLAITDRIEAGWSTTEPEVGLAIHEGSAEIAQAVLALALTEGELPDADAAAEAEEELGLRVWIRLARIG